MTECIILAGGLGTRLQQYVPDVPKVLAPINGTPFLDLLIKQITKFKKISKIILALGFKADMVEKYCQNKNFDLPIEFSVENIPLGTGGALKKALKLCTQKNVLVLNGDSFLNFNFAALSKAHLAKKADITLVYTPIEDVSRYGEVIIDPVSQKILSFKEKQESRPAKGLISCGFYLIKKDLFNNLPLPEETNFSLEKEAFPLFLTKKRFFGFLCQDTFIDIGTKDSYFESHKVLAQT